MNIYLQMNDVAPLELLLLHHDEAIDITHLWCHGKEQLR